MTLAELIRELQKLPLRARTYIIDDQGFPHDIAAVRFRPDLNAVAIESSAAIPEMDADT